MFDIGFLELFVIGVIALIVLGPERLPKAARTVGLWVGKAKQGFNSIKHEIDRELKVQEIQQELEQQKAQLEEQIQLNSLKETMSETQTSINQVAQELNQQQADDMSTKNEQQTKDNV